MGRPSETSIVQRGGKYAAPTILYEMMRFK
jgi:hypothetical protein